MPALSDATSLALFGWLVVGVVVGAGWATYRLVLRRWRGRTISGPESALAGLFLALAAVGVASFFYGLFVEADWLSTTFVTVETPKLARGTRLRIVHLTDLHADHRTTTLDRLPAEVAALAPDVVVFTGDSINHRDALPHFREVLGRLDAPLGRFAVKGNHDVWEWHDLELFDEGVATELTGPPVRLGALPVSLCGAAFGDDPRLLACVAKAPADTFRIAAFHTPDLVESFGADAPDLYLAGHTHGGQVRMPFYGAIVTLARHGKKYEMGRYQVGPTTLFVSRGIGFEAHAPRVRFLCRPELAVIDVVGTR